MAEGLPAARVLAATVLVNLGLAGIIGAWASVLWLRGATSPWALNSRRRSRAALKVGLAFTALSDALLLWLQAAYMAELPLTDAWAMLPMLLCHTYVGRAWAGGVLGLPAVLFLTRAAAHQQGIGHLAGAAIGIGLFVYSRAAVSHAGDFGLASLQLLVECAHLWAISLWLGVVGIAAFSVLTEAIGPTAAEQADVARWVGTLSTVATGALVVIVGTGVFNAWRGLGSTADLLGSAYGNALLVKVALVAVAVALGGFNRFRAMPRLLAALRGPPGLASQPRQRFVQVLRIEAVALFAALVAAAVLSSSPLPTAT